MGPKRSGTTPSPSINQVINLIGSFVVSVLGSHVGNNRTVECLLSILLKSVEAKCVFRQKMMTKMTK